MIEEKMIRLETTKLWVRWFVWCVDSLPLTSTKDYRGDDDHEGVSRKGAYYISHGTTLCHLFWATLWMPLFVSAVVFVGAAFIVFALAVIHVAAYEAYSPKVGIAAAVFPEMVVLGFAVCVAVMIFAIIGGSKVGFFRLLWEYLKGIKHRVCPLIQFDVRR